MLLWQFAGHTSDPCSYLRAESFRSGTQGHACPPGVRRLFRSCNPAVRLLGRAALWVLLDLPAALERALLPPPALLPFLPPLAKEGLLSTEQP